MTRPNLRPRMPGQIGWVMLKTPLRLVEITWFHCSDRHPMEHGVAGDARIVDQHLHRPEVGLDLLDAGDASVVVGNRPFVDGDAGLRR